MQIICDLELDPRIIKNIVFDETNKWMCMQAPIGNNHVEYGVVLMSLVKETQFKPIFINDCWVEWAAGMNIDNYIQFCNIKDKCYVMLRFFGSIHADGKYVHHNRPMFSFFELSQTRTQMKELLRFSPEDLYRQIFK